MASPAPHLNIATLQNGTLARRCGLYAVWVLSATSLFWTPVGRFIHYALSDENASHTILIPAICAWLIYLERKRIFGSLGSDVRSSVAFLAAGLGAASFCYFLGSGWSDLNQLSLYCLGLILLWTSGFALLFGRAALREARFPLCFLLFTVPFPDFLLDRVIYFLQSGTTEIAAVLFDWSAVPVIRNGFVFHFANVNIEIARECSGIRSSLALLILAVLVAHFYLRSFWKQALLVFAGIFVMLVKNGVRVVTLTLLASYVDPGFLYGRLHREGGVVFFLLGMFMLAPLLWLLQRSEKDPVPPASA